MPGLLKRVWNRVKPGSEVRQERRENAKRYRKTRKERKELEHKITAAYTPKRVKGFKARQPQPLDYFYLARAEAKRQRKRHKRLRDALAGGWGEAGRLQMVWPVIEEVRKMEHDSRET